MPRRPSQQITKQVQGSRIKNRTIFTGDNLEMMRGMQSNSIDMIYLDPPFNSNEEYSSPIGLGEDGEKAAFNDVWTLDDVRKEEIGMIAEEYPGLESFFTGLQGMGRRGESYKAYLVYMAVRLREMHRILKPTGSIYLHCDSTMVHYLKATMDFIFGLGNYRNQIIWKRTSAHNDPSFYGRIHDIVLFYTKTDNYTWNVVKDPLDKEYVKKQYNQEGHGGKSYRLGDLTGPGTTAGSSGKPWRGIDPSTVGRCWSVPKSDKLPDWARIPPNYDKLNCQEKLDILDEAGLVAWPKKRGGKPRFKGYLSDDSGTPQQDMILNVSPVQDKSKEAQKYPTQKPLALLRKLIASSTNKGDVILDPFCGCATTCVAAEEMDREWIGIDTSELAGFLIKKRLLAEVAVEQNGKYTASKTHIKSLDYFTKGAGKVIHSYDPPMREGTRSKNIKHMLYADQMGHCNGCCTHFDFVQLTVDHKKARNNSGPDIDENKQLLCHYCNSVKGDRLTTEELIIEIRKRGLMRADEKEIRKRMAEAAKMRE